MFFTNLFNLKKSCKHELVTPDIEAGYCPDCGKYIQNEWYITRCTCCGVKLKTMFIKGEIKPQNHYCSNCGSDEFTIEKLSKINFIDVNYAVLVKKEIESGIKTVRTTQCWEEKTSERPKLLTQFL